MPNTLQFAKHLLSLLSFEPQHRLMRGQGRCHHHIHWLAPKGIRKKSRIEMWTQNQFLTSKSASFPSQGSLVHRKWGDNLNQPKHDLEGLPFTSLPSGCKTCLARWSILKSNWGQKGIVHWYQVGLWPQRVSCAGRRVQAHVQALYAISVQPLEIKILKCCDAP